MSPGEARARWCIPGSGKWCLILLNEFVPEHFAAGGSPASRAPTAHLPAERLDAPSACWIASTPSYRRNPYLDSSREPGPPLDARSLDLRRKIVTALKSGNRGTSPRRCRWWRSSASCTTTSCVRSANPNGANAIASSSARAMAASRSTSFSPTRVFPGDGTVPFCKPDGLLGGHPGAQGSGRRGVDRQPRARPVDCDRLRAGGAPRRAAGTGSFAVIGDGESNEGSIWEAALCAGKHRLSNLTVIVDYNKQQSYGTTRVVQDLEPLADKWRAFNFAVAEVDGHDVAALRARLRRRCRSIRSAERCHLPHGERQGHRVRREQLEYHHLNSVSPQDADALFGALGERSIVGSEDG